MRLARMVMYLSLLALCQILAPSCGATNATGGTEAGNFRTIEGDLSNSQDSLILWSGKRDAESCSADLVIATDTENQETETSVNPDCTFSLELEVGKAYRLHLESESSFVATMQFDHNASYLSSLELILSRAETSVDLGRISVLQGTATPENQPAAQNDQDGDGISDYDDSDDDGDGVPDDEEPDCDENGIPDDYDPASTCLGL